MHGQAARWMAGACALALAGAAHAQTRSFDLSGGDLGQVLAAYAKQAGVQLIYRADEVKGVHSKGAHGRLDAQIALSDILAGTGFGVKRDASGAMAVVRLAVEAPPPANGSGGEQKVVVRPVVITGMRNALRSAVRTKRDGDTVVESITANDIGAFPDKSVAEALQRMAGVTVNRFAASDDSSHFSAEPSGVLVRGLPQVRNELDGRDTFSADSGRGLGWGDVSPELLAGVDAYKNQTAEMIEGGIAGTVNLRTRMPFDAPGPVFAATANMNYGDLSQLATPEGSAVVSDRWRTPLGDFGLLANLAYSDVETRSQGIQYGRMGVFDGVYGPGTVYIPSSVAERDVNYDRKRLGEVAAGQWRDPSGRLTATVQFDRSAYSNTWKEYGVISYPVANIYGRGVRDDYSPGNGDEGAPLPAPGTSFAFDRNGEFRSGVMDVLQCCTASGGGNSYWGPDDATSSQIAVNSSGQAMLHPCYTTDVSCAFPGRAPDFEAVNRYNRVRNVTRDGSLNLKWKPDDQWRFNFDFQRVHATVRAYDVEVGQYSFADLSLNASGAMPRIDFLSPTNINPSPGGLSNPDNYRYNHVMDHLEDSQADERAARLDGEYLFQKDWLNALKFGVRYSQRRQDVRYSDYNWGNIANDWNLASGQSAWWNIDRHAPSGAFTGYPLGLYQVRPFGGGGFFGGASRDFVFFNEDLLAAGGANLLAFSKIGVGQDHWEPICQRPGDIAGGCFQPDELDQVTETTRAAYLELKFGGPNAMAGPFRLSGNLGLRYVDTRDRSVGGAETLPFTPGQLACVVSPPPPPGGAPTVPKTAGCYLTPAQIAFSSGALTPNTIATPHHNLLPSFNLKLDVDHQWVLRFAASRALSRPDIGLLKNYLRITPQLPDPSNPADPRWVRDGSGQVTGVNPTYVANAYNPALAPSTADQFDVSLERYFGDAGYVSVDLFAKRFDNYIQYGTFLEQVTINGVTAPVSVTGPANGGGARLSGVEVSYQRFFDFLPSPWNGLGVQGNYSFVDDRGVTNSNLKVASGGVSAATPQAGSSGTSLRVSSLEQLSRNSYNLIGIYEKGRWAARLAYSWRSRYLVTAVDCCIYLPIWADAAGFLDGSVRYRLTPHIELSVQGSNLLDTQTVLRQQVNDAGRLEPGSWFQNDRRLVAGVRIKY